MGRVIAFTREDVYWPFRGNPRLRTRPSDGFGTYVEVDPFPAYSHDAALVTEVMGCVEYLFPVKAAPTFYLLPHEDIGRTNGYASKDYVYKNGSEREEEGYVILSAKRIPPHPAMTRYLVAHEYGHHVQWDIERRRGCKDQAVSSLMREYMELRPGSHNHDGGGLWHSKTGELFANDFRILVAGYETEFWPHAGFPHPRDCAAVQDFWSGEVEKCPKP